MTLNDATKSRLENWKFAQAKRAMQEARASGVMPEDFEVETIEALAAAFGNCGWFEGTMANIVRAAVWALGVEGES